MSGMIESPVSVNSVWERVIIFWFNCFLQPATFDESALDQSVSIRLPVFMASVGLKNRQLIDAFLDRHLIIHFTLGSGVGSMRNPVLPHPLDKGSHSQRGYLSKPQNNC